MDDTKIRRSLFELWDQFLRKRRTMSRALAESRTTTHSAGCEPTDQAYRRRANFRGVQERAYDERVAFAECSSAYRAGNCLNECGENLVPTEGWGDRSQNCLHDVRIVGNT
jgi:hypothetical protein